MFYLCSLMITDAPAPDVLPMTDAEAARAERLSQALEALAELGLGLARAVHDEARGPGRDAAKLCKLVAAYDRIGRAVRLTVALTARLVEARRTGQPFFVSHPAAAPPERDAPEAETTPEAERERPETQERPDRESLLRQERAEAALMARPPEEIYARICRDLGVDPDPGLFPDNDDDPSGGASGSAGILPASRPQGSRARTRLFGSAAAAPMAAAPDPSLAVHLPP
jgi:hypothetical protein